MSRRVLSGLVFVLTGLPWAAAPSGLAASDERPPIRKTIPEANLQIPGELEACAAHLKKLHAAVKKYESDQGSYPDWLSALVPKYLDKKDLLCPVHGRAQAAYWPDPHLPCSYTYEFSATKLSDNWVVVGGMVCRDWKNRQVKLFGDVVPLVRCFHQPQVLSLSAGGQVFVGLEVWERVFMPDYQRGDELEPSERPFRYAVPVGGVDALVKFIEQVKAFRPETPYQILDHSRTAPLALKAAATRILSLEKDEWSPAYQTALRVLLEDRLRTLASDSPAGQRATVEFVKTFLTAKRDRRLEREDLNLAMSAAKTLADAGHPELAAEAYREFAALCAASKDQAALDAAKQMEAAASKLRP